MRPSPITILAVFAHPDDEVGVGSTLAYYNDQGAFSVLACASRGEAATIYCENCATRENLADVRTHELECACTNLGVTQLRWLDWPDGGIKDLPHDTAVRRVVALIREICPDIILTHPEHGLYPHPDHLTIWGVVREAYDAAADLGRYTNVGQPWAVSRLFTRGIPKSYFDAAPEFAAARVELNGQQLPFYPTPDEDINVVMEVASHAQKRLAAWDCHRSQHNPDGVFSKMPDNLRQQMAENEYYVLEASRVPLELGVAHDLMAGLDEPPTSEDTGALDAIRDGLAVARGYLAAINEYGRQNPKPGFHALLKALEDGQQEALYFLAGALRRAGRPPGAVEPDTRVVAQALSCHNEPARKLYLRAGMLSTARWCQTQAAMTGEDDIAWTELAAVAEAQLQKITEADV